jgi:hypothetical protein
VRHVRLEVLVDMAAMKVVMVKVTVALPTPLVVSILADLLDLAVPAL